MLFFGFFMIWSFTVNLKGRQITKYETTEAGRTQVLRKVLTTASALK
jgi:hypothetical protein